MKALCLIRSSPVYRREAFVAGLNRAGYKVVNALNNPDPDDILVGWNRYGNTLEQSKMFERRGARCLIVENGYLSALTPDRWFSISLHEHAGLGEWNEGGPERWDAMGVELLPWRTGPETLILAQRGIGSPDVASPDRWAEHTMKKLGVGRIRRHPANRNDAIPLGKDLERVGQVVTWASSAALVALTQGIPCWYGLDGWIGASACRPVSEFGQDPKRDSADRLAMFRRLAWAQWRVSEIESGAAFMNLLDRARLAA